MHHAQNLSMMRPMDVTQRGVFSEYKWLQKSKYNTKNIGVTFK